MLSGVEHEKKFYDLKACVILHAFLSSGDYFQNQLFRKIISGIPSECQTD